MVRIIPGHGDLNTRCPTAGPSNSLPSSSTTAGSTPKKGKVADPGFSGVAPGRGVSIGAD